MCLDLVLECTCMLKSSTKTSTTKTKRPLQRSVVTPQFFYMIFDSKLFKPEDQNAHNVRYIYSSGILGLFFHTVSVDIKQHWMDGLLP